MSEIKLKRIISFTSEDDVHKAENLLNHGGKWLCAKKTDQTKHSVTIQLEKETKIRQVNIENEFSAFVEVWIGPEGAKSDDDFKTLLEATSFMTPGDSKNSTNGNRLKIFTNESMLNKAACELDSGVVKILCTQPFNKDIQFGIGSIKLFDKVNNDDVKDAAKLNTGVFSLKKELSDSKPVPSSPKVEPKKVVEEDEEKKPSPAKESLYDKWKKNNKTATAYDSSDDEKADKKKKSDDESKPTTSSAARNSDSKPGRRSNEEKPGNGANSILRGVIFALSGFVNPLRGEIRDKGMKLGAKYRPDWTDDCTHLVTAFSNTPKVKQVKKAKKGAIVTKDWIYECEKAGKRLDANDYEVASDSDSSDDDDDSKPRRAAKVAVAKIAKMKKRDELLDSDEEEEEAENSDDRDFIVGSDEEEEDDDVSESESKSDSSSSSSDEDRKKKKKRKKANKKKEKKEKKLSKKKTASKRPAKKDSSSSSSSSDSESDLEKYKKKKESEIKKQKQKKMKKDDDKEESNDDKENLKKEAAKKPTDLKKSASSSSSKTVVNSDMEENGDDSASWKLPTFFDEKIFFIVPDYDAKKRKALSRIIYAYGGNVSDYMSDEVDYVITDKQWDKDFDEALKENNKLKFIESDWLNTCNSRKKLIPYQPFEIVRDL